MKPTIFGNLTLQKYKIYCIKNSELSSMKRIINSLIEFS